MPLLARLRRNCTDRGYNRSPRRFSTGLPDQWNWRPRAGATDQYSKAHSRAGELTISSRTAVHECTHKAPNDGRPDHEGIGLTDW